MNNAMQQMAAIGVAVLGVAIVAILVSRNANTSQVIQAAGSAFGGILGQAMAPVTGSSSQSSGLAFPFAGSGGINGMFQGY